MWAQEPDEHPSAPLGKALKPQKPLLNYGGLAEGSPWPQEASSGQEPVPRHQSPRAACWPSTVPTPPPTVLLKPCHPETTGSSLLPPGHRACETKPGLLAGQRTGWGPSSHFILMPQC